MTKLEETINQISARICRPTYRDMVSRGQAQQMCKEMAREVLELPELKALIESLNFYGDRRSWLPSGETNCFQKILGADGEEMDNITNTKHWVGGNWARQALSQWRTFIGEVENES